MLGKKHYNCVVKNLKTGKELKAFRDLSQQRYFLEDGTNLTYPRLAKDFKVIHSDFKRY